MVISNFRNRLAVISGLLRGGGQKQVSTPTENPRAAPSQPVPASVRWNVGENSTLGNTWVKSHSSKAVGGCFNRTKMVPEIVLLL